MTVREAVCILVILAAASPNAMSAKHAGAAPAPPGPQAGAPVAVTQPNAAEETLLLRLRALLLVAAVPVGLELRPFGADAQSVEPLPPRVVRQPNVTVPSGPPPQPGRAGLESFVLANRGYELVEGRPLIAIRPVGASKDAKDWLNTPVSAYDVRDATIVDALAQLLRRVDPAYEASRIRGAADINATRITLTLSTVTVRDVLDAIALDQHAVWIVTFSGAAPSFETSRTIFATARNRTHLTAYPGPPPAEANPPSMVAPRVIPLPLTVTGLRNAVVSAVRPAPAGFELGPDCHGAEAPGDHLALDLTGLQPGDAVQLLLAHCPGYEGRTVDGVLNIGTVGSFERSPVMNLRARVFGVAGLPFRDTLQAARRVFDPNLRPGAQLPQSPLPRFDGVDPDRAAAMIADMTKPIDLKVDKPTLRAVLNGLVAAHGAAYWVVEPAPPPSRGPFLRLFGYAGWSVGTTFSQGPGPG